MTPKLTLIESTDKRSFCIYKEDTIMQGAIIEKGHIVARSIDYTKFDGKGFDLADYEAARNIAEWMVEAYNKVYT